MQGVCETPPATVFPSRLLFALAAVAEIGGAWLVGRILAGYGDVFVIGSLLWGTALDGFRPDRYDVIGALLRLAGVAVIMYARRPA